MSEPLWALQLLEGLTAIGELTEDEVVAALYQAYITDPTVAAARRAGASDARLALILLHLLHRSREAHIKLLEAAPPPTILIPSPFPKDP